MGCACSEVEVFYHTKEDALEAVKGDGFALEYAAKELRADREVVLQAVKQKGGALVYAAEELRADREVVLQAVKRDVWALQYAAKELRVDKGFVLQAVKQNGFALQFAAEQLRADREVTLEAVKQDGCVLRFAAEQLRADREVVLEAVRSGGYLGLRHAADELRRDPDVRRAVEARENGLSSGKRITFLGSEPTEEGGRCAASFPGKFADKWEHLTQRTDLSVACVFLTSPEDGLGRHSPQCMCHHLYGKVSPETYLAIVEKPTTSEAEENYEENLAFLKADAAAMGQILIEAKAYNTDAEWDSAKTKARVEAQRLCEASNAVAPWGCYWFELWKTNIEKCVELKQELLVYYFPNMKGKGKVPWNKLNDADAVDKAKKDNGLGNSQRAEVAYLDYKGYPYTEVDVGDYC